MKKLLLVAILAGGVFFAWRAMRSGPETQPVRPPVEASPNLPKAIPQKEAISGSTLNKVFPHASDGYQVTFTQEKDGFSQADLSKGGTKVATLTVSDTAANPSARDKFKTSSRNIGGYPSATVGTQGTAVLVADRYQVQARSLTPAFSTADREAWLAKFKLTALAAAGK